MKKHLFSLLLLSFFLVGSFCSAGTLDEYRVGYGGTVSGIFKPGYSYIITPLDSYMSEGNLRLKCFTWDITSKLVCGKGCSFDIDSLINEGCSPDSFALYCYASPCNFSIESISPPLLPGGQKALSGVVSNLTNSVNEFIPYIVYIGIGILSLLIGFVAIKRLINRLRNKTLSPFK